MEEKQNQKENSQTPFAKCVSLSYPNQVKTQKERKLQAKNPDEHGPKSTH